MLRKWFVSEILWTWLSLSEFKFTDIEKQILYCRRQLNFFKNTEKYSPKTFILLKFRCNLLSITCLLEFILSLWERKGISLSPHVATKQLLTSFALLLRLSNLGAILETITEFPFFVKGTANSIDFGIWLAAFPLRKSFVPPWKIKWSGFSSRIVG